MEGKVFPGRRPPSENKFGSLKNINVKSQIKSMVNNIDYGEKQT